MEVLTRSHVQLSDSDDSQTAAILIPELDKKLEISNSECKTTTPDEKTEEKQRVFVPGKESKVPKSPTKLNLECKTPTPDEKTDKKERILVPKNGSMDRSKVPKSPGKVNLECKTPTQRVKIGGIELPKNGTPNRLKLPIAFKYPERYKSPTDLMISPISKGLLARTRKGAVPSKMHELRNSEMSLLSQS
ncbi:uncharacterized protein E5676_scaffold692G00200 [Cucumis melo var. makuwa]|uniref:Uncharacterized protein n=1 Tax=Cucumis melo var. makuwa TaxID=1194695 RepID=A0A5A7UZK0_CUCMM|nr:uncharacterized protein E6C27_scaffold749G00210 [Cucumis melo var. makuwa]TYK14695.1 uncharacterized protein E5676_scaffold692G00200 [Cucumis melo var. makuwa]